MVKISFIVPIYNVESYIKKCINSLLNQKEKDIEIILVNDGSPDRCGFICEEYANNDNRIKVVHKENGGVSSARNAGLEIAKGEYVWFVDPDDWVEPNAVQNLWNEISNSNVDMVIFGFNVIEDKLLRKAGLPLEKFGLYKINLHHFFENFYFTYKIGFSPWNKIYKREVIINNNLLFDREESFGEDLLFNLYYYLNINSIFFSENSYYNYNIRVGSAERTPSKERHIQHMRIFEKFVKYTNKKDISPETKTFILPNLFFIHLTSGVKLSKQSGIKAKEFQHFLKNVLNNDSFKEVFNKINIQKAMNLWLKIERASLLSKVRFNLFIHFCNLNMYSLASKLLIT